MAPEPSTTSEAAPAAASDTTPEVVEPTFSDELLETYKFSPPILVAWGLGYFSDQYFFLAMALMGFPLFVTKLVDSAGGPGAWAKKAKAPPDDRNRATRRAEEKGHPVPPPPAAEKTGWDHFVLPRSTWLPPLMIIMAMRGENVEDTTVVATGAGVYLLMCAFQFFLRKIGMSKE